MQSNRKRIRKEYAPLTVAQSIVCTTPASTTTQVYNGILNEWEADRELTPTVILPDITANATDGSWPNPRANSALADMHWFVNGKDIATLADWAGKYTIEQVGDNRGAITISKNISPGDVVELHFEAVIADNRLGVNIPVVTDKIALITTEKATDGISVSLTDTNLIEYDPMKDRLAEYDYQVAHGNLYPSKPVRDACIDNCAWHREIPFTVMSGKTPITSGYTVQLFTLSGTNTLTRAIIGTGAVQALTLDKITLDLRLIEKMSFVLKVYVKNIEVASVEFGVSRVYQDYSINPTNGTGIHHLDTERYDRAMVDCDGNIVENPGRILKIEWYTETAKGVVKHNEGDETLFSLEKAGVGNSYADSWLETYCESEYKAAHRMATVGASADHFVDSSGNTFIFN